MISIKLFLNSIQGRLIVGVALLHIILMGIFVYSFIVKERQNMIDQSLSRANDLTHLIAANASLGILNNDVVALGELVDQVDHLEDIDSIMIMDRNYQVKSSDEMEYINHSFSDNASLAIQKDLEHSKQPSFQREHDGIIDTLAKVEIDGTVVGYIRIITSTDDISVKINDLWIKGLGYILLSVLIGGTFAWWFVRILTHRIALLSQAASQIAKHNYDIFLPPFEGKDELSNMGNAFRLMIDSIQQKITELQGTLAIITATEAEERERSEKSERYQNALFEWSTISYESSEKAIEHIIEIASETLQIERVSAWLFINNGFGISCQDLYTLSEKKHQSGMVLESVKYPVYFQTMSEGKIINAKDAVHDPRTMEFAEDYLKPLGIGAMLDMPISQNGQIVGVVCCEHVGGRREWTAEEQEFMLTISNSIALSLEIEKRKHTEDLLAYQAQHDELTNLCNRSLFMDRLEHAVLKAKRMNTMLAVMFIDLDHFKEINDSYGHSVGDEVLISVARELNEHLRDIDTIARLGGDEFTLIIEDVDNIQILGDIANKLIELLQKPIIVQNQKFYVTSSIGISLYPIDGNDPQSLLRNADSAMYKAKGEGRNSYQYYTKELTERAIERVAMESNLRQAILKEEFEVYYQIKMDGKKETPIGMEALIRWNHPELGMVSPGTFIPLAEETGMIVMLDEWVMKSAMSQIVEWRESGLNPGVVSLNLTKKQLRQKGFIDTLKQMIEKTGCHPEWIELEVTEGDVMKNPEESIEILKQIRGMGIKLALDDFGTGYSSLAYLKRLPINILKIDQSFVKGLPDDTDDIAIVRSTIALAASMGMETIAEGVETLEQKNFLIHNGCSNIQGYLYGRPIPVKEMTEKLGTLLTNRSI